MPNVARKLCGLVAVVLLSAAGCSKPQPAVKVTTRAGGTFLIAHPIAKYERFCSDRSVSARGDPDEQGLRIAEAEGSDSRSIAWSAIEGIDFHELVGDLGAGVSYGLCEGSPKSINATVTFKDGHREQRQLTDTTDQGIAGVSERGPIVVPLRDIARLVAVEDENWPWIQKYERDYTAQSRDDQGVTLNVKTFGGASRTLTRPEVVVPRIKTSTHWSLQLPLERPDGLPVIIAGARITIRWQGLRRFEGGRDGAPARIIYTDNDRTEAVAIVKGIIGGIGDTEAQSEKLDDIARLDVSLK
jgi:hypothetical protein